MTDQDTQEVVPLVRETMRRHEHLAEAGAARLLPAVRDGVARRAARSRLAWIGVAAAVAVAAGAVPAAFAWLGHGADRPPSAGGGTPTTLVGTPPTDPAPDGWRSESSLGLVVTVPQAWAVNDFGCNQTDASTVVRDVGAALDCFTPEPATKELAILGAYDPTELARALGDALLGPDTPGQPVTAGLRFAAQLPDGRYAGVIFVTERRAALIVRTRSAATTDAILDSLRVVEHDQLGCPVERPEVTPSTSDGDTFVNPAPAAIVACHYDGFDGTPTSGRLLASGRLDGDRASGLAALLNAAPPGLNPDVPADQCVAPPASPDAVLYVYTARGTVERVWALWSNCVHRGLTNGVEEVHVSGEIVAAILNPLHVGYGINGDI